MADLDPPPESSRPSEPITDSPWLWFALFSAVGLAALLATGGKFGKRQSNIERQYQARAAVASGRLQIRESGVGEKTAAGVPAYVTPQRPAIPVWPLEIILGLVCAASFGLLLRQRLGVRQPAAPP